MTDDEKEKLRLKIQRDKAKGDKKEAEAKAKAKQDKQIEVQAEYDVWDDDGDRCKAGERVTLSLTTAKRLMAEGKVSRCDPLPE